MMLHHIGEESAASRIEKALVEVYRRGQVRTQDLGGNSTTDAFADAVCRELS
jgi:isocitrate dehydrogenase (NAD+)